MRNVRAARILGFVWEILRFGFISLVLIYYINPKADLTISFFVILAGSSQLLIPAGLILMIFRPERYAPLNGLLALGKGLSVVSILAVLVTQSRILIDILEFFSRFSADGTYRFPTNLSARVLIGIAAIGLVDLILMLYFANSGGTADG